MQVPQESPKKRGPKPTGKGSPVMVRCKQPLLDDVDDWRSRQRPIPSRAEAIRQLTALGLAAEKKGRAAR